MDSLQYSLFKETHEQRASDWIHTPAGGDVMDKFIRLAIACKRRGQKVGAKAIAERLRWHYEVIKAADEAYKINNNYVATMARFAMDRAEELRGFFSLRDVGREQPDRKIIVIEQRKAV